MRDGVGGAVVQAACVQLLLHDALCVMHVGCRSVSQDGVAFCFWDVGGCDKIRPLWRHYFQNCQVLLGWVGGLGGRGSALGIDIVTIIL